MTLQTPHLLGPGEGDHFHFLNTLQTIKVDGKRSDGVLTALEFVARRDFGPPLHSHDIEDELFYIVDGEVWFSCAGEEAVHGPGSSVWLPKGLPHTFQIRSETAKIFQISTPAQFDEFVATLGQPAAEPVLPEPGPIDPAEVARVCADFQIQVLGPPPASST